MCGQRHAPAVLAPGNKWYLLYRRKGGPQSRSGRVGKISPSPGFDPRTVQNVASHYTDRVIRAPRQTWTQRKGFRMYLVGNSNHVDWIPLTPDSLQWGNVLYQRHNSFTRPMPIATAGRFLLAKYRWLILIYISSDHSSDPKYTINHQIDQVINMLLQTTQTPRYPVWISPSHR